MLLSAGWNELTVCFEFSESENLGQSAADQVAMTRHDGERENPASYPADLKGLIETAPTAVCANSLDCGWSSEHPDGVEESASKLWPRELVFVDARIHDYQQLVDDLLACGQDGRQIQVIVLDSNLDGIAQISQALAGYQALDAVHFVSHGTDRAVKLGSTWLNIDSMQAYAGDIAGWQDALADEADLLFYGYNLAAGEDGRTLIEAIGELTRADVTASIDDTGHARLGGDWELEYHIGSIETDVAFSIDVQQDWLGLLGPGGWQYRRQLTFSNSSQSEDLIGFPVLVALDSSRIDYSQTQDNGQDIRFFDADDTTPLAYEIEKWNESGTSYVWVKVPQIDRSSNTDYIWMYYGNSGAADEQDAENVWDANYMGVWHLNEGGTGTRYDSTLNNNDGTPQNYDGDEAVSEKIDGADDLDGIDDYIAIPGSNIGTTSITVEAWVKFNALDATTFSASSGQNLGGTVFSTRELDAYQSPTLCVSPGNGGAGSQKGAIFTFDSAGDAKGAKGQTAIQVGQWYYLVGVFKYTGVGSFYGSWDVYLDGNKDNISTNNFNLAGSISMPFNGTPWRIGDQNQWANGETDAVIDEVRISNIARRADWIAAQNDSMTDAFISYGAEEETAPVLDLDADDSSGQSGADFATTFAENGGAVLIADSDATLSDVDSANLQSLTVTITNLLDGTDEVLAADTTGTSISASYNSGTGVLTLSGADTVAHYQQVLRTITYNNTSQDPDTTARSITFVANDGTNDSNTGTTTLSVASVNDAPTVDNQSFDADENSPNGTAVGTVLASDPENDGLSYAITAGNMDNTFAINASTGQITVNNTAALDYEANPTFNLTVEVTDDGTPSLTDAATVTIDLNDLNEAPTVDDQNFSVDENRANGTVVGTVVASDPDDGDSLTYFITGGNTDNAFAINSSTGQITVNNSSALDFETNPTFNLSVEITDSGTPGLTDTATVSINLSDLNETPTIDDQALPNIDENSANGTVVGTVLASDPDTGDSLTYSINGGNTDNAFAINSSTGQITVNNSSALDFETNPSFSLTVQVEDSGGLTETAEVMIALDDVLDVLPPAGSTAGRITTSSSATNRQVIRAGALLIPKVRLPEWLGRSPLMGTIVVGGAGGGAEASFYVAENCAPGAVVGKVPAPVPEASDSLTYSIKDGNTDGAFAIDPDTGQITVSNSAALDYETNPTFSLTVEIANQEDPDDTRAVPITIHLVDINEEATPVAAAFLVEKHSTNGSVVGIVFDGNSVSGQQIIYSIKAGNVGNAFAINASTGQITVNNTAALDYKTNPTFTLAVEVVDGGHRDRTHTIAVTIYVIDLHESLVEAPGSRTEAQEEYAKGIALIAPMIALLPLMPGTPGFRISQMGPKKIRKRLKSFLYDL